MAYNKFKTETLTELLGIEVTFHNVIPYTLPDFNPSALLLSILDEANNEALGTEKAKSEHIILPVIKELKRKNPNTFSYFSGYKFDVDRKLSLIPTPERGNDATLNFGLSQFPATRLKRDSITDNIPAID